MVDIQNALKQLAVDRDTNLAQYQKQLINTYQSLYSKVEAENDFLKQKYANDSSSASLQNSKYVDQSRTTLRQINTALFWIYLVLALVFSGLLIRRPLSIWFKILLVGILIGFPFYIYLIEKYLYIAMMYIYSLLLSITYDSGYGNTLIEYSDRGFERLKHAL